MTADISSVLIAVYFMYYFIDYIPNDDYGKTI
jgi:hypothetical protein